MAYSNRFARGGWMLLLAWPLAVTADVTRPNTVDQEWRERFVLGFDADRHRNASASWQAAQAGMTAARAQGDVRAELRAAAHYFAAKPDRRPEHCTQFTRYVGLARAGGKALERELFDLGAATAWAWAESPCSAQVTIEEMQRLAEHLGDSARMFYVLELKLVNPWMTDRYSDAISIVSQQLEHAISGFQRASRLLYLAKADSYTDRTSVAFRRWIDKARQEFDPEAFPALAVQVDSFEAAAQFRSGNPTAAMGLVRRVLPRLRQGAVFGDAAAIIFTSFASYLLKLERTNEALQLLDEARQIQLTVPAASVTIASTFLVAYGQLGTPEAFAKGEREIQRIEELARTHPKAVFLRPITFSEISQFYERFGRLEAALRAHKRMVEAMQEAQRRYNENLRLQTQERLDVAMKDKENAQLKADAELQAERQRGWIAAFVITAVGVAAAGTALAVAVRRGRRLARVSAELEKRNGELEQHSASRIRLLAAACHDLRQPAHALGMLAEIGGDAQQDPSQLRAWLQSVRRSTSSLGEMLDELMDLGRLDGGHYTPQLSKVPLGELMLEVALHFNPLATRKGLALHVPPVDLHVTSDRHLLRRILFNVVSNAIKYTDQGEVRVTLDTASDTVRLSVQDTGPGIPQDKIDDVFRDYVRLNPSKASEGLGIGLSIVRRATDLLGHPVALTSTPGKGTCVSLTLPICSAPDAAGIDLDDDDATASGGVVAVIENDVDVRDATAALLHRWGYTVCAGAHADALFAPESTPCKRLDLVITDLHLDQTDGLREIARLRERLQAPALPALLVTGDLDRAITEQAALAGVHVVHKPLAPRKLATLVRQLLNASPGAQPALSTAT